jgi:hypothetical protein
LTKYKGSTLDEVLDDLGYFRITHLDNGVAKGRYDLFRDDRHVATMREADIWTALHELGHIETNPTEGNDGD